MKSSYFKARSTYKGSSAMKNSLIQKELPSGSVFWLNQNIQQSLILFMAKYVTFDWGLSHGVSKIGPTHQITLSTDLDGYRETLAEIRWVESKDERFLQSTISAQEADDLGFHLVTFLKLILFSPNLNLAYANLNLFYISFTQS